VVSQVAVEVLKAIHTLVSMHKFILVTALATACAPVAPHLTQINEAPTYAQAKAQVPPGQPFTTNPCPYEYDSPACMQWRIDYEADMDETRARDARESREYWADHPAEYLAMLHREA
jgi:hypothetical protein